MNFRSTHNGDGEGVSLAGDVVPFPSPARRIGQTANSSSPGPAAATSAGDTEGAGVSSASASSFVPLGSLTHAVVLRLQGGFPKIRVRRPAEGGAEAGRLSDQREEGER